MSEQLTTFNRIYLLDAQNAEFMLVWDHHELLS